MTDKPKCYDCIHRREIPGDCHTRCAHPNVGALAIKGHAYGIKRGWFMWPINFDPVWLQECNGFEAKAGKAPQ